MIVSSDRKCESHQAKICEIICCIDPLYLFRLQNRELGPRCKGALNVVKIWMSVLIKWANGCTYKYQVETRNESSLHLPR